MDTLPDEILLQIIQNSDVKSIANLSLVDKKFYNLTKEFLTIVKSVDLSRPSEDKNPLSQSEWRIYTRLVLNGEYREQNFFKALVNNYEDFISEFYNLGYKLSEPKQYWACALVCYNSTNEHNFDFFKTIHKRNKIDINYTVQHKYADGVTRTERLFSLLLCYGQMDTRIREYLINIGVEQRRPGIIHAAHYRYVRLAYRMTRPEGRSE